MVKFGNVECETCGQEVKKKQLNRHKCVKKDPNRLEKCNICGKEVHFRHYSEHYKRCRTRDFWNQHKKFFFHLLRVVRRFNREIRRSRYIGTRNEQKKLIADQMGLESKNVDLRKNQKFLLEVAKVEESETLKNARETAEEYDMDLENMENVDAIKDAISFSIPRISCRQIIFDFLERINLTDQKVHDIIDKKLIKKDYPTDEELMENETLFNEIKTARNECGYNTYYEKFYYMLVNYYKDRDTAKCPFCAKFVLHLKPHLRKCNPYRKHFYENEEETIKFYLNMFHGAKQWEECKLYDYVNYYKQYSFNYFIETIEKRLKNRRAFMERIAEGKRRFAEMNACKNKKEFVRNLIAEVDAMPLWTWSDEENEKDGEVKEEAIEENKMVEKVKEKDAFDKALEEVEKDEENEMISEEDEKEEKLDEEKTKNTWTLLLGGKFKAKLEEMKNIDISSSSDGEDDAKDLREADILNN